jgi:hypothetical protein
MTEIVIDLFFGGLLGFVIGLTGVGGGVLTVPVLILILRLDPIQAVGTASFYAVLTKIYAGIRHFRQGTINLHVGLRFLAINLPGVALAAVAVKSAKASLSADGVATLETWVTYAIIASITFSIGALLVDYSKLKGNVFAVGRGRIAKWICVFLIGAVMGVTSVGGGVLIIPALLLFYRETEKYVGTSIFVAVLSMMIMSIIYAFVGGGGGHGSAGDVNVKVAALMAVGSLVGTHYGTSLSKRLGPQRLQRVVVGVVVLAVIMMLIDHFI